MEFAVVYSEKISTPLMPSSRKFDVLRNMVKVIAPEDVKDDELMEKIRTIHDEEYIRRVRNNPFYGPAVENIRCILQGIRLLESYDRVIVPVTAAGHLAEPGKIGGHCIFNGLSLVAKEVKKKYSRIAVIETDAHHGNAMGEVEFFCIGERKCKVLDDMRCVLGRNLGKRYVEAFVEMLNRVREYNPDVIVWYLGLDIDKREYAEMELGKEELTAMLTEGLKLMRGRKAIIMLASGSREDVLKDFIEILLSSG